MGPKWEDYLLFTFAKLFIIHEHPYTFSRDLCCPLAAWLYITQDTPKWNILNSDQSLLHTRFPHFSLPYEAGSLKCFCFQIIRLLCLHSSSLSNPNAMWHYLPVPHILWQEGASPKEETRTCVQLPVLTSLAPSLLRSLPLGPLLGLCTHLFPLFRGLTVGSTLSLLHSQLLLPFSLFPSHWYISQIPCPQSTSSLLLRVVRLLPPLSG